jgi:peptide/nickel transport system permease protein
MARFLIGRAISLVVVLIALTFVTFLIQAAVPSDPVAATLGGGASKQVIAEKRHELGYDRPIYVQYERFLKRLSHADLGVSLRTHDKVLTDIGHFAPATIELAVVSLLFVAVFAFVLGLWSASQGLGSGLVRVLMIGGSSLPSFLAAILLVLLFYSTLHWLPASGRTSGGTATGFVLATSVLHVDPSAFWDDVRHVLLPAIVVAIGPGVAIGRVLRGALLEAMRQDYAARTARSKGLSSWAVLVRHGVRNALTPTLSMAGLQVGLLLTGVVVVESVFAWPGLGLYTASALQHSDFPAIVGVTFVLGVVYVVVNALVDVLQVIADPRLKDV